MDNGLVPGQPAQEVEIHIACLNPYCSGQWSRTILVFHLGLIVVSVLILIVVDNGLVQTIHLTGEVEIVGLNPYCSGQWSRTFKASATDLKKQLS